MGINTTQDSTRSPWLLLHLVITLIVSIPKELGRPWGFLQSYTAVSIAEFFNKRLPPAVRCITRLLLFRVVSNAAPISFFSLLALALPVLQCTDRRRRCSDCYFSQSLVATWSSLSLPGPNFLNSWDDAGQDGVYIIRVEDRFSNNIVV